MNSINTDKVIINNGKISKTAEKFERKKLINDEISLSIEAKSTIKDKKCPGIDKNIENKTAKCTFASYYEIINKYPWQENKYPWQNGYDDTINQEGSCQKPHNHPNESYPVLPEAYPWQETHEPWQETKESWQ